MRWLYPFALSLFLSACGGGGSSPDIPPQEPPAADACSMATQQAVVSSYMGRNYFWYDHLGTANPAAPTIDDYFDSLLYKPTDRFSFTEPTETYTQRTTTGVRPGYGYTLTFQDAAQTVLRVRNVEPQGPAARAGLQRGDTILSIDGFTPAQVAAGRVPAVTEPGILRRIVVKDAQAGERTIAMVSAIFPLTLVPSTAQFTVQRLDGAEVRVGYLAYQSFAAFGNEELRTAFQSFADAGVQELVLDLRYNGGGSVMVSRDLASIIGADRTKFGLYTYLRFNKNNLVRNESILFAPPSDPTLPGPPLQALQRLVVIAGPGTASASELVINGLKPYMPVKLVGATTYGKPYGSLVQHNCGTTYHAIHFTTINSLGEANYQQGFAPDCSVADDLDHQLGDPNEARLAAALHVAKTGQCPVLPPQRLAKPGPERVVGDGELPGMYVE